MKFNQKNWVEDYSRSSLNLDYEVHREINFQKLSHEKGDCSGVHNMVIK